MGNDFGLFGKIYEKGEIVCRQGDPGDEMYIIQSGAVEVSSRRDGHKVILTILEKEDLFGEMSLIAGGLRTASAKARSPVRLRSISREDMLTGIRSDPETGLLFLRILIDRLRVMTSALEEPQKSLKTLRHAVLPKFKAIDTITIGFSSLSSCGGCAAMLVRSPDELSRVTDKVQVRYCPMLMDQEQILETDIAVVDGAVRTREDEEKLTEVRRKSRFLIAWGTCAAFAGLPALANAFELEELIEETYGQSIDPFSYYLRGSYAACPRPQVEEA